MQWPVKLVPRFLLVEDNPNLIAPYFDCCSILHNSTTWPDSHMALCHNFHSSVHLLWWNENFAKPKQMSFKGLSASRIFHALNFWTSAISGCRSKAGYAYAWYRRSRRRKVLIRPKNSGCQWMDRLSLLMLTGFLPKRAKLFLCPSDAPSYVCWTLLRLIKHFMLTWHFLQGVASCDPFFGWSIFLVEQVLQVDIRAETFWQGLLACQLPICMACCKNSASIMSRFLDLVMVISWLSISNTIPYLHLTRTKRYQERMRVSICHVCNMLITLFVEF